MSPAPTLSPLDSILLKVESDRTPMHMVSIAFFEAGPLLDERGQLRIEDLRRLVSSRLDLVPKLRQVARPAALREAPPSWADEPNFDIANHVTMRRLPAPGTDEQLLTLCSDLVSSPLNRDRPLWELTFVEGLESGQIALIEKLHHSMADGIAAAELALVLLDVSPESAVRPSETKWQPNTPVPFVIDAARDLKQLVEIGVRVSAWTGWSARHPLRRARQWSTKLGAAARLLSAGPFAASSPLNRQVGAERQVRLVRLALDDVRGIARDRGGTVNDVVLTLVTHGLHKMVASAGWNHGETMNALVPVGLAAGPNRGIGNHVSALIIKLPVDSGDAEQTFMTISAQTRRQKQQHQEVVADAGLRILEPLPQTALTALSRFVEHQPFFNLIVTNVPGPDVQLYALGARMLQAFPLVPLVGNQGLGVAALSYMDQLNLGLLTDPTVCPDLDSFCEGVDHAFDALVSRVKPSQNRSKAGRQA